MGESKGEAGAERGSGSALALSIACAMVVLLVLVVPLYTAFASRSRLAGAADAAALAAADIRSGFASAGPGAEPCAVAGTIAAAAGLVLGACQVDGLVVTVVVTTEIVGIPMQQSATAGPPPGPGGRRD